MKNAVTALTPQNFDEVERFAKAIVASGFFTDLKQLSQAIVKIVAGSAMALDPFTAVRSIYIIQDKNGNTSLTLSANLMAAAIKRTGRYNYKIIAHDEKICDIEFFEIFNGQQQSIGKSMFSIDDAKKAGLINYEKKTSAWLKYPRNMLFSRAISNGLRWYCPDCLGGNPIYTPEEIDPLIEIDEEGEVIKKLPTSNTNNTKQISNKTPIIIEERVVTEDLVTENHANLKKEKKEDFADQIVETTKVKMQEEDKKITNQVLDVRSMLNSAQDLKELYAKFFEAQKILKQKDLIRYLPMIVDEKDKLKGKFKLGKNKNDG